jgi:FkbM family methyltransferase
MQIWTPNIRQKRVNSSSKLSRMKPLTTIAQLNLLPCWRRELKVWDFRVAAPSLDRLVCLALHRWGLMGAKDLAFYKAQIKEGMTVVDVGANQGLFTLVFSRLAGASGSVIAFEPEPDMYAALEHNCKINRARNIEYFPFAVGASVGKGVLSRSLVHGGDGCMTTERHMDQLSRLVDVQLTSLDVALGDRRVDFVKIDVQGAEMGVFQGMTEVMRKNPALRIYFEYWPRGLQYAGDPMAILTFLHDRGFRILADSGAREIAAAEFGSFRNSISGNRFANLLAMR